MALRVGEMSDLVLELVRMVNTLWGVYATVTLALLGWIFGSRQKWLWQQRLALSIAFGAVATINCLSQLRFNDLVAAAVYDLKGLLQAEKELPALPKAIEEVTLLPAEALVTTYVLVTLGVVYLTWQQPRYYVAEAREGDEKSPTPGGGRRR